MNWFFSAKYTGTTRLDGKTAVITGCNCGIGKETAQEFYKRGARVIMACRDVEKANSALTEIKQNTEGLANTGELIIKSLDLSSFKSIRECAEDILEHEEKIHLLINNAGVMGLPRQLSADGFEMHFAVNHLGHFLFTVLLLPKIISSSPARIVTVSSEAHRFSDGNIYYDDINMENKYYYSTRAYGRSKLANILFSNELGKRLKGTGVTTYSLHPGVVNTEITRYFANAYGKGFWLYSKFMPFFIKNAQQGAQTTLYCSLDEKCANETALYYSECSTTTPSCNARNAKKAEELWQKSIEYVHLESDYDPFKPL